MALLTEDSHEQVQGLITIGKERGYVLIEEVNEAVGAEVHRLPFSQVVEAAYRQMWHDWCRGAANRSPAD